MVWDSGAVNTRRLEHVQDSSRCVQRSFKKPPVSPMEQRDHVLSEEDAARITEHMNAEHEDDLLLFAQVYAGEPGATAARMTDIDADGITLEVTMADGEAKRRIDFETPVHTPEDAHRALVDMALNARG